jgi:mRNA interferase YafQ
LLSLKSSKQFKKDYKLLKKQGLQINLLKEVIDLLLNDKKLPKKYRDHALTGRYKGFRECHIMPDWLFIYMADKPTNTLRLVRTGSHSELLNM